MRPPTILDFAVRTDPPLMIGAIAHLTGAAPTTSELIGHIGSILGRTPTLRTSLADRWIVESPRLDTRIHHWTVPVWDDAARDLTTTPLPHDGPRWDLIVVDGYEPLSYALCFRVDHCVFDYGALAHLVEVVLGPVPASSAVVPDRRPAVVIPRIPAAASRLGGSFSRSTTWPIAAYGHSPQRAYHWSRTAAGDLDHPRATRNDVYIAAMAGAVGRWLSEHGVPSPDSGIEVLVPVNVRRPRQAADPGNHTAPLRIRVRAPHPESVARVMNPIREPGTRQALRVLLDLAPRRLLLRSLPRLLDPAYATVVASSFRLRHALSYRGDPVVRMDPIVVAPNGYPVAALALTYGENLSVSFATDSALPDMDRFHQHWADQVTRVSDATES
ncbi:hypothetical protein [Nocardia wallacei]|uniref:hypothetical protein n=1 Tax=Nocardia wallacei TaxID=480035 RepID=UPI0024574843|nr:hypothetical protein [Nocardia wallacei]